MKLLRFTYFIFGKLNFYLLAADKNYSMEIKGFLLVFTLVILGGMGGHAYAECMHEDENQDFKYLLVHCNSDMQARCNGEKEEFDHGKRSDRPCECVSVIDEDHPTHMCHDSDNEPDIQL